mgnify:FL=1
MLLPELSMVCTLGWTAVIRLVLFTLCRFTLPNVVATNAGTEGFAFCFFIGANTGLALDVPLLLFSIEPSISDGGTENPVGTESIVG